MMHLKIDIKIEQATLDNLCDYVNDSGCEFAVDKTKSGEVPSQEEVGHNIENYLEYSLAIKIKKKLIGFIFLKKVFERTVEMSIIIKEEYRHRNLLRNLLVLNKEFRQRQQNKEDFLQMLSLSMDGCNIVTSVTRGSFLEKALLDIGFTLIGKSLGNDKVLYSLQ